jgi:hypothetical protein
MPLKPLANFFKSKDNKPDQLNSYGSSSSHSSSSSNGGGMCIGTPTDFKHNVQVKHDKVKNQFIGLPPGWRSMLEDNNIK